MAVPIIPILKKVGSAILSDKKGRKTLLWVILTILCLLLMPIFALLAIFGGGLNISYDNVNTIISQQQIVAETTLNDIETEMTSIGIESQRIEEAQAIYSFALWSYTNEDNFVYRFTHCYELEQTDDELIEKINNEFGTSITTEIYESAVKEVREKYTKKEDKINESDI